MSSEWRPFKLTEVGRIVTGKTPLGGQPEFFNGQVPFVTPPDFAGQKWIAGTARTVSELGAHSVKGSIIPPRSVLVTCIGSDMGKAAIASARCLTNQQINAVVVDETKFLPEFLFYNLALRKTEIRGIAGGSAQPILNKTAFGAIQVFFPSRGEQSRVVALLRPLDDRIALLRETNATLEAIVQALFKSWFVDFDPVRAKQQRLVPVGMDNVTASVFPDSYEDSQRGSIPAGWSLKPIYEVAAVIYGAPFASSLFNVEGVGRPLIRIRDLRDEAPGVYTPETHPKGYIVRAGDIVVGMDGEFRAYLWGGEEAWLNQRVCVFAPKQGAPAAFVRSTIEPLLAHVEATETATTVIHLGKNDIDHFRALVPSPAVLLAFASIADPVYARIVSNKQAARTLAALRDTLLPRLISGQLRLPEAEAQLADAVA